MSELLDKRLLFITGKGGVGKTSISTALALVASGQGKRTLLCEIDDKGEIASLLGVPKTSYHPKQLQRDLWVMLMETESSLREYLNFYIRLPSSLPLGPLAKAFDFIASAAPGAKEILTIGKLTHEVHENNYDLVIVDSPATGHVMGNLIAPKAINDLISFGMIKEQTQWMLDILSDPFQTGVCVVTTPEEMPVNETIELSKKIISDTTVPLASVIVNRVLPELFSKTERQVFDSVGNLVKNSKRSPNYDLFLDLFRASELALELRSNNNVHLEFLNHNLPLDVPILHLPYLFSPSKGSTMIDELKDVLSQELGF